MTTVTKKYNYKPLNKEGIALEDMLTQASTALDDAARLFLDQNDPEGMIKVAAMWLEFIGKVEFEVVEEEVVEVEDSTSDGFGFQCSIGTLDECDIDDVENIANGGFGFGRS